MPAPTRQRDTPVARCSKARPPAVAPGRARLFVLDRGRGLPGRHRGRSQLARRPCPRRCPATRLSPAGVARAALWLCLALALGVARFVRARRRDRVAPDRPGGGAAGGERRSPGPARPSPTLDELGGQRRHRRRVAGSRPIRQAVTCRASSRCSSSSPPGLCWTSLAARRPWRPFGRFATASPGRVP